MSSSLSSLQQLGTCRALLVDNSDSDEFELDPFPAAVVVPCSPSSSHGHHSRRAAHSHSAQQQQQQHHQTGIGIEELLQVGSSARGAPGRGGEGRRVCAHIAAAASVVLQTLKI